MSWGYSITGDKKLLTLQSLKKKKNSQRHTPPPARHSPAVTRGKEKLRTPSWILLKLP